MVHAYTYINADDATGGENRGPNRIENSGGGECGVEKGR